MFDLVVLQTCRHQEAKSKFIKMESGHLSVWTDLDQWKQRLFVEC